MNEQLKDIFSNINYWLEFAEKKNALLFAANVGISLGGLRLISNSSGISENIVHYLYFCIFLQIGSALCCMISFMPTLKIPWFFPKDERSSTKNLLFWGHIHNMEPSDYLNALRLQTGFEKEPSQFDLQYAEQIIANAKIAYKKYKLFHISLWLTMASFVSPVGVFILWCIKEE